MGFLSWWQKEGVAIPALLVFCSRKEKGERRRGRKGEGEGDGDGDGKGGRRGEYCFGGVEKKERVEIGGKMNGEEDQ